MLQYFWPHTVHEKAGYNHECTDSTSQFAREEYNHHFNLFWIYSL